MRTRDAAKEGEEKTSTSPRQDHHNVNKKSQLSPRGLRGQEASVGGVTAEKAGDGED